MIFDVPNFPTDSLHKFKAIVGLVLALGGLIYLYTESTTLREKAIDIETRTDILKVRQSTLPPDSVKINSIKIKGDARKASLIANQLLGLSSILMLVSLFGIWLAKKGFDGWGKVQSRTDKVLKKEASKVLHK